MREGPVRLATRAMGTRFEFVLIPGRSATHARAGGEEAIALIHEWHDRLSAFDPGSLISTINREARRRPVRVDDELFDLLGLCERVRVESDGAFDVSVGSLMRACGFRPTSGDRGEVITGERAVMLDASARTVTLHGDAEIDLGAIAKGAALDEARRVLIDAGVHSALIHGGSSTVVAIGAPPGQDAWRVRLGEGDTPAIARLRDQALSYSSARGDVQHVMDPRRGAPASACRASACLGDSAALTDAWATALLVRGRRPASMPDDLTSAILINDAWTLCGADGDRIELQTQEMCS